MQSKNLDNFVLFLIISTIIILLIFFIGFILVIHHYRRKKQKKIQAEISEQFTQTLLKSQLEIREQTLQYIGSELHDNLGQIASLIKINLNTLQLDDIDKAKLKIEDTKDLTRRLINDLKALSISLGANRIGQVGLAKALEAEIQLLNRTGTFISKFTQDGPLPRIDDEKTTILFRMSQEVLNNIIKHSQANLVTGAMIVYENMLRLTFTDDGVGFDIADSKNLQGAGMINLRNRAKLINAQISIESNPEYGTIVNIEVPF